MQRIRTDRLWLLGVRGLTLRSIKEAFAMAAVDDCVYRLDRSHRNFVLIFLP